MEVEIVKIQTKPSAENPTGMVVINKEDFNPEVHVLFEEKKEDSSAQIPPNSSVALPADQTKK